MTVYSANSAAIPPTTCGGMKGTRGKHPRSITPPGVFPYRAAE